MHRSWACLGSSATVPKAVPNELPAHPSPSSSASLARSDLSSSRCSSCGQTKTHKHADHACAVWGAALSINRNSQHPACKQHKGPPVWLLHTLGS